MDLSQVIEKVKKLLALSKSTNANEAAAAAAIVNKLMDQYRLELADLESHSSEDVEPIEKDTTFAYKTGRVIPWKKNLLYVLANHYGCDVVVWQPQQGRKYSNYLLIGKRSDIQICRFMYSHLTLECERLSSLLKGKGHVYIFSFCDGFVAGIKTQLNKSREEISQTADQNALTIINSRLAAAERKTLELFPNLEVIKTKNKSRRDREAWDMGKEVGEEIHLGASLGPGKGKLLGSGNDK